MENKHVLSVVLGLGLFVSVVGCGGVDTGTRACPNGQCAPMCTGDTYALGNDCVAFTVCSPGWYLAKPGTATTDAVCELCSSGTFSNAENSSSCTPWSPCPAGTYVVNGPTTTMDRSCITCPAGSMTTGMNQSYCTQADQCPAGTVQSASGTMTSAPVCDACRAGEYCGGGTNQVVPCSGEKWDDDMDPATICVSKTVCGPGNMVVRGGSATADRGCVACPMGAFSMTSNAQTCQTWATCEAGTYSANVPSAVSNRQCLTCPPGTFSTDEDQSMCLAATDCPAGTVETSPGTSTAAPVCSPCDNGEYCAGGSMPAKACADETWDHDSNPVTACVPWTFCRVGFYVALPGSTISDQACFPCPAGTYSNLPNLGACIPWDDCPAGTYVGSPPTSMAHRTCVACSARTFSEVENALSCTPRTECPSYTHYVSAVSTPSSDTVCTACTVTGCTKYCDGRGSCLDCLNDADCQDGATCVGSMCRSITCGSDMVYFTETFTSINPMLWWKSDTKDSPWQMGQAISWGGGDVRSLTFPDPESDHTPTDDNNMAGVIIGGIVPAEVAAPHYIGTRSFPAGGAGDSPLFLEYYHWLNSDTALAMTNMVDVYDGSQWVTIWSGPQSTGVIGESSWQRAVHDVTAYKNPDFGVRFGYQVLNSTVQSVSGWNIDDIRVAESPSCVTTN